MLRVLVDSGSSIKQSELEKYNVDYIPLKILIEDKEYLDGIDLDVNFFYDKLINDKIFPKTSLPNLVEVEDKVLEYVKQGDQVIILPISSGISGTYNALQMMFSDNKDVLVYDTKVAVGGIRILVEEVNKYRNESLSVIKKHLDELVPRIRIMAIPETLEYLQRGGRLSKKDYLIGTVLHITPIIGIIDGKVGAHAKKRGLKHAMKYIVDQLTLMDCDTNYEIVASYTYKKDNLDKLISQTPDIYKALIKNFDDLDPALACHWGPNAFGYIFVSKK